jgi:hypothetical protein
MIHGEKKRQRLHGSFKNNKSQYVLISTLDTPRVTEPLFNFVVVDSLNFVFKSFVNGGRVSLSEIRKLSKVIMNAENMSKICRKYWRSVSIGRN